MDNTKKLIKTIQRLILNLGFILLFWLAGLLIFIPLGTQIAYTKSFISMIVLIPILLLFLRSIRDMKLFSFLCGTRLYKRSNFIQEANPFIYFFNCIWVIFAIIIFVPLVYFINTVLGGILLFSFILIIILCIFINLKYLISIFLRFFTLFSIY